ncbi:MAG: hypothetical protein WC686_04795 [Candidatus Shapirobacteria bacterium]
MSPTFAEWYSQILVDKLPSLPDRETLIRTHPHFLIVDKINGNCQENEHLQMRFQNEITDNGLNVLSTNSRELINHFKNLNSTLDSYVSDLPPLTTGSLYLECKSTPKLVFLDKQSVYVIVRIPDFSYVKNYYCIRRLISKFIDFRLCVAEKIGYIKTTSGCYFFSNFLGYDFESEIIEHHHKLNKKLYFVAKSINRFLRENKIFFRNVSPRNLIKGLNNSIYLIDFDHLLNVNDKNSSSIYHQSLFAQIWFNDVLPKYKCRNISPKCPTIDANLQIRPDNIEKYVLDQKVISLKDRKNLFRTTDNFERKDKVLGLNIYGHQLGRFISDFWLEKSEAALLKFMFQYPDKIKILRALLYILSRVDQELLLRKKYNLNTDLSLLSERFFLTYRNEEKIKLKEIIKEYRQVCPFCQKYKNILSLI